MRYFPTPENAEDRQRNRDRPQNHQQCQEPQQPQQRRQLSPYSPPPHSWSRQQYQPSSQHRTPSPQPQRESSPPYQPRTPENVQYSPRRYRPLLAYHPPCPNQAFISQSQSTTFAEFRTLTNDRRTTGESERVSSTSPEISPREMATNSGDDARAAASSPTSSGTQVEGHHLSNVYPPTEETLVQALEIARESEDGASDKVISNILENGLNYIFGKITAEPQTYILTRVELSLWNYFQHRFIHDPKLEPLYRATKARYWDNTFGP